VGPLGAGWGWALAGGVVSGVDPAARTITVMVGGQGELEVLENAGVWRRAAVAGVQVVHILPSTLISGAGGPAAISEIRPGTPVKVWAAVHGDSGMVALKVALTAAYRPSAAAQSAAVSGVVLRRSATMIQILTPEGAPRGIIVTSATALHDAAGRQVAPPAIGPYDVVRVEGAVNSDGSVAATRIDLDMQASQVPQVSGSVGRLLPVIEGLVVGGVMVVIGPGCYFVRHAAPMAFTALAAGQDLLVYGTPIVMGATPVGLRARVVVGR
jgi:Domain of unknown function (DUF5666)